MTRILVVGVPRSGSTWLAEALGRAENASVVAEPDNCFHHSFALRATRDLPGGLFPVLPPSEQAPGYEELWRHAFGSHGTRFTGVERVREAAARRLLGLAGPEAVRSAVAGFGRVVPALRAAEALGLPERPPSPAQNIIVKSVYAALALEWIAERMRSRVVVVTRDIRNVISSWIKEDWVSEPWLSQPYSPPFAPPEMTLGESRLEEAVTRELGAPAPPEWFGLERLAWFLALLTLALETAVRRHPDWEIVRHETLCADPFGGFSALAKGLGLAWSERGSTAVAATEKPGEGYEIHRVANELPTVWRSRLTSDQIARIEGQLARFPLAMSATDTALG